MTQLTNALHVLAGVLERRGYFNNRSLARELVIAAVLEAATPIAKASVSDLAETYEVAQQLDLVATREFGVATTATRARVIRRLLASAPRPN